MLNMEEIVLIPSHAVAKDLYLDVDFRNEFRKTY